MIKVITAPSVEPVTVAEAKLQTVVGFNTDDVLFALIISAARDHGEALTGRSWAPQTLEVVLDEFPSGKIELDRGPVTGITSVKYIDTDGTEQTLASGTDYDGSTDGLIAYVAPCYDTTWPETKATPGAVRVRYAAGWTAATFPPALKQWMLVRIAGLYAQRESFVVGASIGNMGRGFCDSLLDNYIVQAEP